MKSIAGLKGYLLNSNTMCLLIGKKEEEKRAFRYFLMLRE